MKSARHNNSSRPTPSRLSGRRHSRATKTRELGELRVRLAEAEETLRAIRVGEVDTVVVTGKQGPQVFTLEGAGHAYRVLIESMNEGALTLTADKMIVYANQCFARMVKCPLAQVMGGSFRRFLSDEDGAVLRGLLKRADQSGSKIQVLLNAGDGSRMPVQISIRSLPRNGFKRALIGLVVTDMTQARQTEELLRALARRVVQVQETERGRVALELHDHITQLLCAILFRSQALVENFSTRDGPSRRAAKQLCRMIGQTAKEVERISRNLRPSVLAELGLVAVLRDTSADFAERTGVSLKLACAQLTARLPADAELTLYRILQEALKNIEQHARARHVTVCLKQRDIFVQLVINDDGIGFDPGAGRKGKSGLGLLSMRERATYVGGALRIKSVRRTGLRRNAATRRGWDEGAGPARAGTEIEVRIPLSRGAAAINQPEL